MARSFAGRTMPARTTGSCRPIFRPIDLDVTLNKLVMKYEMHTLLVVGRTIGI